MQTTAPRSPEELEALEALVASAVGFNEERGDRITLRSMSFEPVPNLGTDGVSSTTTPLNLMRLIQIAVLAVVSLVLGLFVVRPILVPSRLPSLAAPTGASILEQSATPLAIGNEQARVQTGGPIALPNDNSSQKPEDLDPVNRLRQMISERETETIQILQDWMEQPDEVEKA